MKKKIIRDSSIILILSMLIVCAQGVPSNSNEAVNFSSGSICSQELGIIINHLEVSNTLDKELLNDALAYFEQCEKNRTHDEDELFLAFKDPKNPKYVELLEKIMPAVLLNSNGDKKLGELPNGDFIKRFLKFYQLNSKDYKELTSGQQTVIFALYERFKLPLTTFRQAEL